MVLICYITEDTQFLNHDMFEMFHHKIHDPVENGYRVLLLLQVTCSKQSQNKAGTRVLLLNIR